MLVGESMWWVSFFNSSMLGILPLCSVLCSSQTNTLSMRFVAPILS